MYFTLNEPQSIVYWRKMIYNELDRPRAIFVLWMACHDRLTTKEKFHRFGMVVNDKNCSLRAIENFATPFVCQLKL